MKAKTKPVSMTTTTGESIEVNIPVGSMDKPSAESERIMRASQDPANWKRPVSPYHTYDKSLADDLCYCYDFYFGGHEIAAVQVDKFGTLYRVTSKGYYYYVGA